MCVTEIFFYYYYIQLVQINSKCALWYVATWNTQCDLPASVKKKTTHISCLLSCFLCRHTPGLYENVADCRRSLPGGSNLPGRRGCKSPCVTSHLKSFPVPPVARPQLIHLSFRMASLLRTCTISLTHSLWAPRWFHAWLQCAQLWEASVRPCRSECKFCLLQISRRWLWLSLQVQSVHHYCCAVHVAKRKAKRKSVKGGT